jgi:glycolate dehydrogenase FAD-linked subunit
VDQPSRIGAVPTPTEAPVSLLRGLTEAVGSDHVYSRPADLAAYAYDAFGASGNRELPLAVVFPKTTQEVSAVMRECAAQHVAVVPRGAGTGYSGGAIGTGAVILSLVRMNRIGEPDRKAMRIRVQAGAVTAAIHAKAAAAGLYYPPDPGSSPTCTIGGNIACNASGPHSLRYGSTADYVTDLELVMSSGEIVNVGEAAAGGYDLAALVCGAEGTLAVVTEASLRLLEAPAAKATLRAVFNDMQTASASVGAIAKAGVVPAALECMDTAAVDAVRNAGASDVPEGVGALVLVEVEGDAKSVDADAETIMAALKDAGAGMVEHARDAADAHRLWAARHAVSAAVATVMIGKVNEDVVVPLDRVAELCDRVREIGIAHKVPALTFGHLGQGNMHVTFMIDPRIDGERSRGNAAAADLFETVLAMGGSLTGEHGVGTKKTDWVERQLGPGTVALMQRIKATLDPTNTLNPGKKIPAAG